MNPYVDYENYVLVLDVTWMFLFVCMLLLLKERHDFLPDLVAIDNVIFRSHNYVIFFHRS